MSPFPSESQDHGMVELFPGLVEVIGEPPTRWLALLRRTAANLRPARTKRSR